MNIVETARCKPAPLPRAAYEKLEDAELVGLCQRRDHIAFETLIKRHECIIHMRLYNFVPDSTDIADVAQEAYIRMWLSIEKLRNPRAFKAWMMRVVTNVVYDLFRRRHREGTPLSLDEASSNNEEFDMQPREIRDPADGPEQIYDRKCLLTAVNDAIAELPPQFRKSMVLRDIKDLPYDEIARITTSDIGTVKSRISRARAKVQNTLRRTYALDVAA